jgi:hypothetical protein
MLIDRVLSEIDLTAVHTILALSGMFLAVYVMQLTRFEGEDREDHWLIREAHRLALVLYALAMLWSLSYSETKQWQPWPSDLAAFAIVDVMLVVRLLAVWGHMRRTGRRPWSVKRDDGSHVTH